MVPELKQHRIVPKRPEWGQIVIQAGMREGSPSGPLAAAGTAKGER